MDKQKLSFAIEEAIDKTFEDSDKIRASRFKSTIQKVVDEMNLVLEIASLTTKWGKWCTCCNEDCSNAYKVRKLSITFIDQYGNRVYLECHI